MLRTVFAFLLGAVVMVGLVAGLQMLGHAIWPPSPVDAMPLAAKVWVLVGYAIAVEIGTIVAVLVHRARWRGLAMALGLLMTGLCALNFWMLPHPWWMVVIGLLVPLPIAMMAGWWMRRRAAARRIVIAKPGGYDALRLVELPDPMPAAGEVRLRVEACGVNYADGIIRMGLYESAKRLHGYPITPGFEVAGVVDAIGDGVKGWRLGDRAIGVTLFGGYTSAICLPVDRVFATPPALSSEQAAAIPTVFLTAWFMAHRQVHPRAGERWLVHSAAGGVGGALLQLARLAGVEATGVVGSAHKIDAAKALGAEYVIDKSTGGWVAAAKAIAPRGFHTVFDANGVSTLQASFDALAPMGKLVIYGFASMLPKDGRLNWAALAWYWLRTPRFNPLAMTTSNRSVLAANLSFLSAEAPLLREGMLWLLERFADGRLVPPPVEAFALVDAADAQRRIESGQSVGKLVLRP